MAPADTEQPYPAPVFTPLLYLYSFRFVLDFSSAYYRVGAIYGKYIFTLCTKSRFAHAHLILQPDAGCCYNCAARGAALSVNHIRYHDLASARHQSEPLSSAASTFTPDDLTTHATKTCVRRGVRISCRPHLLLPGRWRSPQKAVHTR